MNTIDTDINKMFLLYLLCIYFGISGCAFSEPYCSKFSYDEQLLEKMVRMEFQMEKIEESNRLAVEALKAEIGKLQALKAENIKLQALQADTIKLQANSDDMADELTKLRQDVKMIADETSGQLRSLIELQNAVVAFSAKRVNNTAPETGETLVFTSVTTNEGNGYSSTTGEFTVPVEGLYLFHDQMCVVENKDFYHEISIDDNANTKERFYANSKYPVCFTTVITQQLQKGQTVSVKCNGIEETGARLIDDKRRWNMFSGVLLRET